MNHDNINQHYQNIVSDKHSLIVNNAYLGHNTSDENNIDVDDHNLGYNLGFGRQVGAYRPETDQVVFYKQKTMVRMTSYDFANSDISRINNKFERYLENPNLDHEARKKNLFNKKLLLSIICPPFLVFCLVYVLFICINSNFYFDFLVFKALLS